MTNKFPNVPFPGLACRDAEQWRQLLLCACFSVCAGAAESAADPGTCESGEQLDEVYAVHDASWMNLGLLDQSLTPAQKQTHLEAVFLDQQQRLNSNGMNAYTEESVADFESQLLLLQMMSMCWTLGAVGGTRRCSSIRCSHGWHTRASRSAQDKRNMGAS